MTVFVLRKDTTQHVLLLIPVSHPVLIIAMEKSVMSKRTDTFC